MRKIGQTSNQSIMELEKLRNSISKAFDYQCLEKCMEKVNKIKQSITNKENIKCKKQLLVLLQTCELLIVEKVKYFKKKLKKIVYQRTEQSLENNNNRTIKNCKSYDNIPRIIEKKHLLKKKQRNEENKIINETLKTCKQSEIQTIKQKMKEMEQKIGNQQLKNVFDCRSQSIIAKYELKLKEQIIQNQILKTKNSYLDEQNQQLKKKLLNQRKRQDDYIDGLKKQINAFQIEVDCLKKQKNKLIEKNHNAQNTIYKLEEDIKKISKKLSQEKFEIQRSQYQKQNANNMYFQQVKKQLEHLSRQKLYISDMEMMLQKQNFEKEQLSQKMKILVRQNQEMYKQMKKMQEQKDKLELILDQLNNEVKLVKFDVQKEQIIVKKLEQQLFEAKKEIILNQRQKQEQVEQKQKKIKQKTQKIHLVKSLLQQLN